MNLDKPNINTLEMKEKPFEITVDIFTAWDTASEIELVLQALKDRAKYRPDLLYRGFDGAKRKILLRNGRENIESDAFFATAESELYSDDTVSPYDYALRYNKPAIAIYDSTMLLGGESEEVKQNLMSFRYIPRPGKTFRDALLGIVYIKK